VWLLEVRVTPRYSFLKLFSTGRLREGIKTLSRRKKKQVRTKKERKKERDQNEGEKEREKREKRQT